ncbi:MAG: lipocalin family protein [Cytophagales bacterium]|jgi:apolipoprotein D and lipocalin family protein|nr:lipocalin family protein [Cytophagales bacterium]
MTSSTNNRISLITTAAVSAVALGVYLAFGRKKHADLPVAPHVDLDRYLGEWYEIARMPVRYEKGCYSTKAIYAKRPDGRIDVLNVCNKDSATGELESVKGTARVADKMTNAKLKVTFFWPFSGDYWILEVGDNYEYALVGTPDRKSLWILSRTPALDKGRVNKLLRRAGELGFDVSRLIYTKHAKPQAKQVVSA